MACWPPRQVSSGATWAQALPRRSSCSSTEAACDKFEGHPMIGELRTEKNSHWGLFLVVDQGWWPGKMKENFKKQQQVWGHYSGGLGGNTLHVSRMYNIYDQNIRKKNSLSSSLLLTGRNLLTQALPCVDKDALSKNGCKTNPRSIWLPLESQDIYLWEGEKNSAAEWIEAYLWERSWGSQQLILMTADSSHLCSVGLVGPY